MPRYSTELTGYGNASREPALTEAENADTLGFVKEILHIFALVGLRAFIRPKAVVAPLVADPLAGGQPSGWKRNTIIVPAQKEGFDERFLAEDYWCAICIADGILDKIKYIVAYQTQLVSAITHYTSVSRTEPYGEGGKYKVVFSESAEPIGLIPYGDAHPGAMQSPRYTSFERLQKAHTLTDVPGKT